MKIRRALPEDAELIARTRKACWETTYRGIYPDEMIDKYDLEFHARWDRRTLLDPQVRFFLVFDGADCVGYYSYGRCTFGTYKDFTVCLNSVYLLPPYRGQGIGVAVIREVREYCKALGVSRFFCACQPDNHPAMAFYSAMGGKLDALSDGHLNPAENTAYFEFTAGEIQ